MSMATLALSSKGQVVIPKSIRDEFEDLIGMLKHDGLPIPRDVLCLPVNNAEDWDTSERRAG